MGEYVIYIPRDSKVTKATGEMLQLSRESYGVLRQVMANSGQYGWPIFKVAKFQPKDLRREGKNLVSGVAGAWL